MCFLALLPAPAVTPQSWREGEKNKIKIKPTNPYKNFISVLWNKSVFGEREADYFNEKYRKCCSRHGIFFIFYEQMKRAFLCRLPQS